MGRGDGQGGAGVTTLFHMPVRLSRTDSGQRARRTAELRRQRRERFSAASNGPYLLGCEYGGVIRRTPESGVPCVLSVHGPRDVLQICDAVVSLATVAVIGLLAAGSRTKKRLGHEQVNLAR